MTDGRPRVIGWDEMSLNALTQVRRVEKKKNRKMRKLKWGPEVGVGGGGGSINEIQRGEGGRRTVFCMAKWREKDRVWLCVRVSVCETLLCH